MKILDLRRPQVRTGAPPVIPRASDRIATVLNYHPRGLNWRVIATMADCAPGTARRILSTDTRFVRVYRGHYRRR
jgi:hypothetical protein